MKVLHTDFTHVDWHVCKVSDFNMGGRVTSKLFEEVLNIPGVFHE